MERPQVFSYIRFSDPSQKTGTSLERQTFYAREYAKEKGLQFDETLTYQDEGLSGFKGVHLKRGALGEFLELVQQGKVVKGSILVVEAIDRLSRLGPYDAFNLMSDIIKKGITIVTLHPMKEITPERLNESYGDLQEILGAMNQAHGESKRKSQLIKDSWKIRYANGASDRKITGICPEWLKPIKRKQGGKDVTVDFKVIPEKVEVIRKMFELRLEGLGSQLIAERINSMGYNWKSYRESTRRQTGMYRTYVMKTLSNLNVLGYMTPKGRDPIPNYYPAIIDEDTFYQVQAKLKQGVHQKGRVGTCGNLFTHIVKCGYCGASMHPRRDYLICENARRALKCKKHYVHYKNFEKTILDYCMGLNAQDILPGHEEHESEVKRIRAELEAVTGRISSLEEKIQNLTNRIAKTGDDRVQERLDKEMVKLLDEQEALSPKQQEIELELERVMSVNERADGGLSSVQELIDFMNSGIASEELLDLRLRLRNEIRNIIDRVDVYPVGRPKWTPELVKRFLDTTKELIPAKERETVKAQIEGYIDNKKLCVYELHFRSGAVRVIEPFGEPELKIDYDPTSGYSFGGVPLEGLMKNLEKKATPRRKKY